MARRAIGTGLAAVLIVAVLVAPPTAQARRRTFKCFGRTATIVGTNGADDLVGTPGNDVIAARRGDDTVWGLRGHDRICGGRGDDVLGGSRGNDELFAHSGNDRVFAGQGKDFVNVLDGVSGNDRANCGPGDYDSGALDLGPMDVVVNCETLVG
jgi:Ca2+-binding RTX toxin-like protein